MRKLFYSAAAVAALAFVVPSQARASWLSEYLHRQADPYPAYPYYDPAYSDYYAPPEAAPYYYGYDGPWYGHYYNGRPFDGHAWHDWHDHGHGWHDHGRVAHYHENVEHAHGHAAHGHHR